MTDVAVAARPAASTETFCSPIVDLRQYTLFPGSRDQFIELFDREFVETQEAAGMRIIGQFRDLGDPTRFVWMRGFADMPARERALTNFYVHGEAWRQHAPAARMAMIDTSDALLLHPIRTEASFALPGPETRAPLDSALPSGIIVATLHHLRQPLDADFVGFFDSEIAPALHDAGGRIRGVFATEHSPNNFARLPLREGENVFVTFLGFDDADAYDRHITALGRQARWRDDIYPALVARLQTRPQILRLAPTSRSQLRA